MILFLTAILRNANKILYLWQCDDSTTINAVFPILSIRKKTRNKIEWTFAIKRMNMNHEY